MGHYAVSYKGRARKIKLYVFHIFKKDGYPFKTVPSVVGNEQKTFCGIVGACVIFVALKNYPYVFFMSRSVKKRLRSYPSSLLLR